MFDLLMSIMAVLVGMACGAVIALVRSPHPNRYRGRMVVAAVVSGGAILIAVWLLWGAWVAGRYGGA